MSDAIAIRRAALKNKVPYCTNMSTAQACLEAIRSLKTKKLEKVKTVPYKNNYGYMFTSGPNTWHGMEKKTIVKERRCIQVNYVTFETDWKVNS